MFVLVLFMAKYQYKLFPLLLFLSCDFNKIYLISFFRPEGFPHPVWVWPLEAGSPLLPNRGQPADHGPDGGRDSQVKKARSDDYRFASVTLSKFT